MVGNVNFTDGRDRTAFEGTVDHVLEDIAAAQEAGADELIIDLQLQDWFRNTPQMLEMAVEIRERTVAL